MGAFGARTRTRNPRPAKTPAISAPTMVLPNPTASATRNRRGDALAILYVSTIWCGSRSTFADVSVPSGIAAHLGSGMGLIAADYDNDGDTDIIVGNDLRANFVLQNDGAGKFKEVGVALG